MKFAGKSGIIKSQKGDMKNSSKRVKKGEKDVKKLQSALMGAVANGRITCKDVIYDKRERHRQMERDVVKSVEREVFMDVRY